MASIRVDPTAEPVYVKPAQIYSIFPNAATRSAIRLKIATGGAGQSGLIRALAEAFIHEKVKNDEEPFEIAWLASDTSASFNYLASGAADLSITYHPVAERIAMMQGFVSPKSNPAQLELPTANESSSEKPPTIYAHFMRLFHAAVAGPISSTGMPVRFLSRYDKSANNIKESALWISIGQTPWSQPYSAWYHTYVDFPFQALRAAARLEEYTLTDRGTWYAIESEVRDKMTVFIEGKDEDEKETLLNPAHALIGVGVKNLEMAEEFGAWLARDDGGQDIIAKFEVGGTVLYTRAPQLPSPPNQES